MPSTNIPTPVPVTYSITINYQETATNSITDLTGTKWLFNDVLSSAPQSGTISFSVNFASNETNYIEITLPRSGADSDLIYDNTHVYNFSRETWSNEAYRTIEITGGTDATNATLISWLQANATQVVEPEITDLTGTKWLIREDMSNEILNLLGGTPVSETVKTIWNVNFTSNNTNYTSIGVTSSNGNAWNMFLYNTESVWMAMWYDEAFRTIEITGGTDATSHSLIVWLQDNATQIQDEEPDPEPEPEPTPSNPNLNDIFTDVANAIRAKTGKSDPLYPVNFANEIATIEAGGGGAELNIHYSSTTAPSDTSKLWVKTDTEPAKVSVSKDMSLGTETISTLSTTLPTVDFSMASGVVGTKIYLFGGYIGSSNYSKKIYRFDTATETITTLSATLPTALQDMASGVVGTKIYLFGGIGSGNNRINKIYCFDTETETISTLSTTLPTATYAMASGVVGTKIYLFGGLTSEYTNKIYRFDTTTETITTLSATLSTANAYMASGVVGTKVYVFGGLGSSSNYSNKIYRFDTATETITTLSATLPTATNYMASGVVGTKIYLFGGTDSSSYSNKIYCFYTETETISTLSTTLPIATRGMASGAMGTKIYLFGGYNGSYSSIIYHFAVSFALAENNLLLLDTGSNSFNLVNSNALVIEAKPKQVYIGDSNDEGEYVESALYVNGSWQPIG